MGYNKQKRLESKFPGRSTPKTAEGFDPKTFVNVKVPADRADECHAYLDGPKPWYALDKLLEGEHRLTVKWDDANNCAVALLFCLNEESPNYAFILSARGSCATSALGLLAWGAECWTKGAWADFAADQLSLFA